MRFRLALARSQCVCGPSAGRSDTSGVYRSAVRPDLVNAEMRRGERLFVAVPLPASARTDLAAQLPRGIPGRFVVPDKWHFTLRFLGATAPSVRDRLVAELQEEVLGDALALRLSGLGAFPRAAQARVLWVSVAEGAEALSRLARQVEAACTRAGVRADERPYSPHLTISRLEPPRDLRAFITAHASLTVRTTVSEVLLLRSHLGHGPPRYDAVARFPLRPRE